MVPPDLKLHKLPDLSTNLSKSFHDGRSNIMSSLVISHTGVAKNHSSFLSTRSVAKWKMSGVGSVKAEGLALEKKIRLARTLVALMAGVSFSLSLSTASADSVHDIGRNLLLAQALTPVEEAQLPSSNLHQPQLGLSFRFYAHLKIGGSDASEVEVAAARGDVTKFGFGSILVVDDLLTATPDLASKSVGRARGISVDTDRAAGTDNSSLFLTFMIDNGKVKGSIIVVGTSDKRMANRELVVVGGTEDFYSARGLAFQTPVSSSTPSSGIQISVNQWTISLETDSVFADRLEPALADLAPPK